MKCYQRCRHTVHSKITCLGYSLMSFLWRLKYMISDNPCIIMSCKVWYIWKRCIDLWIKKKSSASGEYQVINFLNTKATGASLASIIFHICTCLARQKVQWPIEIRPSARIRIRLNQRSVFLGKKLYMKIIWFDVEVNVFNTVL